MSFRLRILLVSSVGTALAIALSLAPTPPAHAKPSTQTETEGEFLSFDPDASTVTIRVRKPGKGAKPPRNLKLKRGKQASFNVEQEGSVLKRTTVKLVDGTAGKFTDLQAGRKVLVFWMPDPDDQEMRLARSISVFVPAEEQGEDASGD